MSSLLQFTWIATCTYALPQEPSAPPTPGIWSGGFGEAGPERIEELRDADGKDFEVVMFPTGNHSLVDAVIGGPIENRVLRRTVPGLYRSIASWLDRKQLLVR